MPWQGVGLLLASVGWLLASVGWLLAVVAGFMHGVILLFSHLVFQLLLHCFSCTLLLGQGCMHKERWVGGGE